MSAIVAVTPLALVLGLIAGCWWLLRRLQPASTSGSQGLRVVSRVALAPRQCVAVIKAHGTYRLVGYGDGGVRDLGALPEAPPEPPVPDARDVREGQSFVTSIRRAMGGARSLLLLMILVAAAPGAIMAQQGQNRSQPATATPIVSAPVVSSPTPPRVELTVGQGDGALNLTGSVGVAVFLGLLTLLPAAIMVMTSFTRIIVVLGFLRSALGTQTAPPTQVLVILAVLLTSVVMRPTLEKVGEEAVSPYLAGTIPAATAYERGIQPLRQFMLANVNDRDLALFAELSRSENVAAPEDLPTVAVIGAFMTSELRTAFLMGFLLFIPFLVIDLVVSSVLMSLGMFMLPPVMVSLPFKLLLFVLADGWILLVRGMVASYQVAGV